MQVPDQNIPSLKTVSQSGKNHFSRIFSQFFPKNNQSDPKGLKRIFEIISDCFIEHDGLQMRPAILSQGKMAYLIESSSEQFNTFIYLIRSDKNVRLPDNESGTLMVIFNNGDCIWKDRTFSGLSEAIEAVHKIKCFEVVEPLKVGEPNV